MKRSYDTKEEIPAGLESYYTEKDGKFVRNDSMIEAVPAASADVTRLNKALEAERAAHKATKTKVTETEAARVTAAELAETLQLQIDAAGGATDPAKRETQITELVTARVNAKTAPLNKQIDELKAQVATKDTQIVAFQQGAKRQQVVSAVIPLARKSSVLDTAHEDVEHLAAQVMTIDETGKVVVGENTLGFTPGLLPDDFLGELKNKRPHYWPNSQGGGAKGGNGGNGGVNWDTMSVTERGQFVKTHGMDKANAAAKAAGYADAATMQKPPVRK